ncbi:MAG: hypothetical protein JOZ15_05055 [Acidobacteria bacterium]|nr:hypothetical protein [Acidobacteriota bacterium]
MTPARSPVQWALPVAAAAAYLAAALLWVGNDRRAARDVFPRGSVWNTGDDGLSLAFAYLSARAAARPAPAGVAVLTRRLESTPLPPRAVLLRVEPDTTSLGARMHRLESEEDDDTKSGRPAATAGPPLLSAAEEDWVRGGGRLVLALAGGFGALAVERPARAGAARKAFPIWEGVRRLQPDPPRILAGPALAGMQALWLEGDAPVVARLALGAGDLVVLACPEVLHNRLLGRGDHLALLEALAGAGGAGGAGDSGGAGGRPLYFDERAHGAEQAAGMVEILASWGLGPLLLLLAAAAGAAWWRAAVRVGPPDRDDRDTRSEAVELLDSLAGLYDRALGRGDALRLYHESFVRTVAADTGLAGEALAARVAALAPAGAPLADPQESPRSPGSPGLPGPPGLAGSPVTPRTPAAAPDISHAAFDSLLDSLNQAFRRLDDAKRR